MAVDKISGTEGQFLPQAQDIIWGQGQFKFPAAFCKTLHP